MARREITQYFDDINNTPLTDDELTIIRFSIDGNHYVLDLSEKNAAAFREALAPWVDAAQPAPAQQRTTTRQTGASAAAKRRQSKEIREWAKANDLKVSERGKIPASVIEAYESAQK